MYCDLNSTFFVYQNTLNNCDGLILANVASSNFPISFLWSNGSIQNNITNLCVGNYSVNINEGLVKVINSN